MADPVEGAVYTGALVIDVTALGGRLFDLPPGATAHTRHEQEGMDEVIIELGTAAPVFPAVTGLYAEFLGQNKTLSEIRAARAKVDKLAEVLEETEAKIVHERENTMSMIVDAVRSVAKRKGGKAAMLALFEKASHYVAQRGLKAAETRKKNVAAKKAAGDDKGNGG